VSSSIERSAENPANTWHPRSEAQGLLLALSLLFVAQSAQALTSVGPGCTYSSLATAVNDLMNNERAGHNVDPYIAVVGGIVYNEAVTVNSDNITSYKILGVSTGQAFVQIYGDYDATCGTENENGSTATVSASGKSAPVLSIHGNKPVSVILNHLSLANATINGSGGGINFTGSGTLDLTNVDVTNNVADFGGGMLVDGESSGITVALHTNARFYYNTARQSGGGILIENIARLVDLESPTLIWQNTANPGSSSGFGGGIEIYGQASADIGGTYDGLGVISFNHAKYGGGIAVLAGGGLRLFTTVLGDPALIANNTADTSGGGLYVDGSSVCASGYAIDNNKAGIPNGTLGEGSAISVTGGGDVHLTEAQLIASDGNAGFPCGHGYPLPQRTLCPVGIPCNEVDDNGTITGDDSIFYVGSSSGLVADRFESRGNLAGYLARSVAGLKLGDCLIAGNVTQFTLIASSGVTQINGCTLAGNDIGAVGAPLLFTSGGSAALTLANSILALNTSAGNPATSLSSVGVTVQATDIIASEISSLNPAPGSNVNSLDPKFVDPANGNYHLKPESPAVDYHLTTNPDLFQPFRDLDGRARGVRLLKQVTNGSPNDIGAYELQSLGDLIFVDGIERVR
jgi:predicted outer membrane repeat protein